MVNTLLLSIILLQPAESPAPDLRERARGQELADIDRAPISRETAERRLTAILASGIETTETVALLRELAERVEDESFGPFIRYNAAVIAMNEPTSVAEAQELFRQTDRAATDPALRAAARYNLAHTIVNAADAETPADQLDNIADIDERIAEYHRGERAFRSTLDADPDHTQAAKNTERLRQRIKDLRDKRDQLEQQQQALEDLAEQLEDLAVQQQQQADQNESRARQNEPNPEQADQQAQEQQQDLSEQTEQAAQQPQAPEQVQSAMQQARESQSQAEQQLGQGQPADAAESQSQAAEQLRQAAEQARQAAQQTRGDGSSQPPADQQGQQPDPSESDQPPENADQPAQQPGENESTDPPDVDPLAEALIDKERRERAERMRYLQRTGRQRVERDW